MSDRSLRDHGWYRRRVGWIPKPVRKVIVLVIGGTLLLLALLGMILPIMPGVIFIPLALAVLAAEFTWAARWLHTIKSRAAQVYRQLRGTNRSSAESQSQQDFERTHHSDDMKISS